jgi:hypothetical protein
MSWKKTFFLVGSLALFLLMIPLLDKSLPIVRAKESFRTTFPKDRFLTKLKGKPPAWMIEQINLDFQEYEERKISLTALENTYQYICKNVTEKTPFFHYRILNNKLYKFTPKGSYFSETDSSFEKAFKTLLIYANVPDVDFILCPMDGMPEPYMPTRFFLLEVPQNQAPILAQAKLSNPHIVLIPDQFSLHEQWGKIAKEILELNEQYPWNLKKECAVWRGGLTDAGVPDEQFVQNLNFSPRFLLCKLAETSSLIDAGFNWSNPMMKSTLEKEGVMKEGLSKKEHLLHKYLPVLDGHMCTYPGYQWRLLSNSVCLKQTSDQIQWFYGALTPYLHYIPVKNNLNDLVEKIGWAKEHDLQVREISKTAQDFVLNNLMLEDNYLYLYLVFKKLAFLEEAIDLKKLKKKTDKDPQWKCIQYRKKLALEKSWNRLLKS